MSGKTGIQWTEATWNPVAGCSLVSPGCTNCYAMGEARRLGERLGQAKYQGLTRVVNNRPVWTGELRLWPAALDQPLRWSRPRMIFVNSMSDLFHEHLPDEDIAAVFDVMRACYARGKGHIFQVLTKRAHRMLDVCRRLRFDGSRGGRGTYVADAPDARGWRLMGGNGCSGLPNVWLGVSAERQQELDEREPLLRKCPAAVRWLSLEPLLGPIDLRFPAVTRRIKPRDFEALSPERQEEAIQATARAEYIAREEMVDWVVAGGESGQGARPLEVEWVRSIIRQCRDAGTAAFVKQLGARPLVPPGRLRHHEWPGATFEASDPLHESTAPWYVKLRDRKGGDLSEWPEVLRVREMPS